MLVATSFSPEGSRMIGRTLSHFRILAKISEGGV